MPTPINPVSTPTPPANTDNAQSSVASKDPQGVPAGGPAAPNVQDAFERPTSVGKSAPPVHKEPAADEEQSGMPWKELAFVGTVGVTYSAGLIAAVALAPIGVAIGLILAAYPVYYAATTLFNHFTQPQPTATESTPSQSATAEVEDV